MMYHQRMKEFWEIERHWRDIKTPSDSEQAEISPFSCEDIIFDSQNLDTSGKTQLVIHGITLAFEVVLPDE